MELLLTGTPIDAREAFRIGLVNQVLPGSEVLGRALAIADRIAANGPVAVQRLKRTVLSASGGSLQDGFKLEAESKRVVLATADAKEGPRAFIEKRPPRFTGT